MAISYPVTPPTVGGERNFTIYADYACGRSVSPYTFDTQIQEYEGAAWALDVNLAPMKRADAEEWIGFLLSLHGVKGTFYWGDPLGGTPRGVASGTPQVDGAGQTGQTLNTKGWTTSQTGIMLAGDWFSIGNSLYRVMEDADSDGSGDATLEIFPPLRQAYSDSTALDVSDPVGIFRLADGQSKIYSVDARGAYLVAFSAVEAL